MQAVLRVTVRTHTVPGTTTLVRDYFPARPTGSPLLWIHGGAFAGGDIDMPESNVVAHRLAASGRRVRTLQYRLAPDFSGETPLVLGAARGRYPAAQDDVLAAFTDLAAAGPAFLGGASAGACIAAGSAIRMRDEGGLIPTGLALVYGVFHSRLPAHLDAEGQYLTTVTDATARRWMTRMMLNYVGVEALLTNPQAIPGEGNPSGLSPVLILDAEHDVLRASGKRFAQQLRTALVPTAERVVAGAEHGFFNNPSSPHFEQGMTILRGWLDQIDHGNRQ